MLERTRDRVRRRAAVSGASVAALAAHLGIGRRALYRTFAAYDEAIDTTSEARRSDEQRVHDRPARQHLPRL
ncbi:hypothetical protein ACH4MG_34740 [Streptomyces sp. NPDC017454]|uniref:hypothetical protein n=1 Tax=Streptomyces sp. NPDC017454 TaxID=3364997 RepID=UPI003790BD98